MIVLIRRRGKFYRFSNSEDLLHVSEAEIVSRANSVFSAQRLTDKGGQSGHSQNSGGYA